MTRAHGSSPVSLIGKAHVLPRILVARGMPEACSGR